MKKQGFTLIELLAVIVILAIIALIAVPIILNIIGSSKKSAVVRSGELYLKAVETAIARENLNNQLNPTTCIIGNDGNLTCDEDKTLTIQVNGSKPTSGTITLEKGKIKEVVDMTLDGFELEKKPGERLKIKGTSSEAPNPVEPENPKVELNPKGTYLMVEDESKPCGSSIFLKGQIRREAVEKIIITNTKIVPNDVIGSWDVSEVQDGSVMAWYTDKDNNNLYELYIGGEDGVKANPCSSDLFSGFNNVTIMDLTYLDTSQVLYMEAMFYGCSKLTNLNLSNFNTNKVTTMQEMFDKCQSLTEIDISNFDVSNVDNMESMFSGCSSLTVLDLSNFNTSQVTITDFMFYDCKSMITLDISKAIFENVTDSYNMFYLINSELKSIIVKDVASQTFINSRLEDAKISGVTVTIA